MADDRNRCKRLDERGHNGVNHGPVTRKGSRETKRRPWMEQRGERKPGKKKLLE